MRSTISLAVALICLTTNATFAESTLVRVIDAKDRIHVGILQKEIPDTIEFLDLKDGTGFKLSKADLKKLEKGVSDDVAIAGVGISALTAWRVSEIAAHTNVIGKIARISQSVVYLTLGEKSGIAVKNRLNVYRVKEEIRDPDTNKLLGTERSKVGVLEVTEVNQDFSKAKLVSELEVSLEKGDEVEETRPKMQVAVLPLRFEKAQDDESGVLIAEDLTTQLIRHNVAVLERSLIDKMLTEQLLQNTVLFDPQGVQRFGSQVGASVVLSGKIVPGDKEDTAFVRLIDVASGKILFASRGTLKRTKRVVPPVPKKAVDPRKAPPESKKVATNPDGAPDKKKFRSTDVELTDKAPADFILKEARNGATLYSSRDYCLTGLPDEIAGGTLIWREGFGSWLPPGTIRALRDCYCYAIIRYRAHGKTEIDEVAFVNFDREGWEDIGEVETSVSESFDWRFKALRKRVPAGDVFLQLAKINFGNRGVLFVFKAVEGQSGPATPPVNVKEQKKGSFKPDNVEFTKTAPNN